MIGISLAIKLFFTKQADVFWSKTLLSQFQFVFKMENWKEVLLEGGREGDPTPIRNCPNSFPSFLDPIPKDITDVVVESELVAADWTEEEVVGKVIKMMSKSGIEILIYLL